jgi:crotonobetainyl-CoA:carnitine CoA-transferase CaiB-like acyl-CoA transferase
MPDLVAAAYTAVTGAAAPSSPLVRGEPGHLLSRSATEDVAVACVAGALLAAADLQHLRTGTRPTVELDRAHIAAAVRSERYFRVGGAVAGAGFAPLSRFWRCADGWLRTHANFPWHLRSLLDVLGTDDEPDAVAAAIAERTAIELEDAVFAAGGVAARVRSPQEWLAGGAGRAVAAEPLLATNVAGAAPPRARTAADGMPAGGLRVLDLTRVIAGPVCTRLLGTLGADVLRLDPPGRPDVAPGAYADTLLGKRSAFTDLATAEGIERVHDLLADADVLVTGYRPGALARFGLEDGALAERHRGLVVVRLSAWGHSGPWHERRGFDSIVQAATGVAVVEAGADGAPGALPCQLLDHGTGYLAAAAALDGVRRQAEQGGTHVRTLSLARTAHWLLGTGTGTGADAAVDDAGGDDAGGDDAGGDDAGGDDAGGDSTVDVGDVTAVAPPGRLDGVALEWPDPPTRYGQAAPTWST